MSHLDLKVGFEIHQQLATERKLFCCCKCEVAGEYYSKFIRKMRPVRSELGLYDAAVLFEHDKDITIEYGASRGSSCLVEADEEPPHDIDGEALEIALIFSLALHSRTVDEVQVMRKVVIDGSNTSGFQRTALIALGGSFKVGGNDIGVQTICLEEDASRLLFRDETIKKYGIDRLGTPLIEIALEPVTGTPSEMSEVALTLGRLLRSSKRVARGLGSIRQDINVSILGGPVVEVKGVQKLEQLTKVVEFEAMRQHALVLVADELARRKVIGLTGERVVDVTDLLCKSGSTIVRKILGEDSDSVFMAILAPGFAGTIGMEPYPGVRLGKELARIVGLFGLKGVIHSDEQLSKHGLTDSEIRFIKSALDAGSSDAFVLVGGSKTNVGHAIKVIIARLDVSAKGVPPETRLATPDGRTEYMRPRPGSARMYPETDIPPVAITKSMLTNAANRIPRPWDEMIKSIEMKYGLNTKIARQIFDSDMMSLFEDIMQNTSLQPTFVGAKLTEDLISLERKGLDSSALSRDVMKDIFIRLNRGAIAKEAVVQLFEVLMKKEAVSVDDAIAKLGSASITDDELSAALDSVIAENVELVKKGSPPMGLLMGRAMAVLRGKADGQKINKMLKEKLARM